MAAIPIQQPTGNKRIYQIALYGLSGSGKTCLLAALAMDRYPNPFGFTVTWLTSSAQTGKKWLQQAINALENNQVPPPNPNTDNRFTFEFMFAYRGQRYQVRMFDYSGELVSPHASDTANAENLRKALAGMDALLILAPAPHPNEDHKQLSKDLNGLQRTFASFSIQREQDIKLAKLPIALIFNMWDRRSGLEHATPENEWKELEEYLQLDQQIVLRPIPHRRLYDDFRSGWDKDATTYQPGELWQKFCDFKASKPIRRDLMPFPLSAFGEYETVHSDDGTNFELPKEINPLHSFGLEDPFVWALFRCQEIEAETEDREEDAALERLSAEATRLDGTSRYLRFFELLATRKLVTEAQELLHRLTQPGAAARRYSELQTRRQLRRPQAEKLYARLRSAWITQTMMATAASVFALVIATFSAEFAWDSLMLAKVQSILANPESKQQDIQWAETWQDTFAHSPVWQHLPYALLQTSKEQFAQELQIARTQRIERTVEIFDNPSKDLNTRVNSATEYLRICGQQCTHLAAAQGVQQEYRQAQDDATWNRAQQANTEVAVNTYLEKYPLGKNASAARQLLGQIMKTKAWQQFRFHYENSLRNGEILEVAKMLEERPTSQDVGETRLRSAFPATAASLLATKVTIWKERQEWTEAMNYLQQVAQIPADVWPSEQRNLLLNNLSTEIKQAWDRALYQAACDFRTQDKMNEYVTQAPLGTMKAEVERYLDYLNQRAGDNSFRLLLTQVQWNGNVKSKTYAIYGLNVQDQKATSPQMDGPSSDKVAVVNLAIRFTAKYTDTVPVLIHITGTGWFGESLIGSSGTINLTVQNILRGTQLTLHDESDNETGQAFLALSGGVGSEPALSSWRAP